MLFKIFFLCLLTLSSTNCGYLLKKIGGDFYSPDVSQAKKQLSPETLYFIKQGLSQFKGREIHDFHTHIVAVGDGDSGAYVSKDYYSLLNPKKWLLMKLYMSTLGITDESQIDKQFVQRLVSLVKDIPIKIKLHILAFDEFYEPSGQRRKDKTEFYIPNEYVYKLSQKYPQYFVPVISVHPYRKDASKELEKWAKKGVRYVKWLPNAMGINPSHPKTTAFYKTMLKYDMTLLSHGGHEMAVASKDHSLGNPQLLRKPLDMGVKIIVAHSAILGENSDLDSPQKVIPNFKLFMRMFKNQKYKKNLFGGLSATFLADRLDAGITELISTSQNSSRLVYGSDYPIPAFNVVIRLSKLVNKGLLKAEDQEPLKEVYKYNPLLFSLLLASKLQQPESHLRFSPSIFKSGLE